MGNLTIATIFIVVFNILMWFVSISMMSINPGGTICYNLEGSIIDNSVTQSGNISIVNNDITEDLPEGQGAVTSGTTNIYTDPINSILSWFKTAPGLKYIYGVIAAPYNILKCMGLPNAFAVGIGVLWYLVSALVLVAFIWGRD